MIPIAGPVAGAVSDARLKLLEDELLGILDANKIFPKAAWKDREYNVDMAFDLLLNIYRSPGGLAKIATLSPRVLPILKDVLYDHPDAKLARRVACTSGMIEPLIFGGRSKDEVRENFKRGGTITNDEKKAFDKIQKSMPQENRQMWESKWVPRGAEGSMRVKGELIGLQYSRLQYEFDDPAGGGIKVKVKEDARALLDAAGRIRPEILFPTHSDPQSVARAAAAHAVLRTAMKTNMAIGALLGDVGQKAGAWLENAGLADPSLRGKAGLNHLAGDGEEAVRRSEIIGNILKMEILPYKMLDRVAEFYEKHPGLSPNGEDYITILLGFDPTKASDKATVRSYCDDGTGKFSYTRAIALAQLQATIDGGKPLVGRDGTIISPHPSMTNSADRNNAAVLLVEKMADHYQLAGFSEYVAPEKIMGVPVPGYQGAQALLMRDKGVRPNQAEARVLVEALMDQAMGPALFSGYGFTSALGATVEILPGGPGGARIRIIYPDKREVYLDADDYYDTSARTMSMQEAAAMHGMIQRIANDPLNNGLQYLMDTTAGAMFDTVPGARGAYNQIYGILHYRNSLLPKSKQLSTKALDDWAKMMIKRTILSPLYVYDPVSGMAVPRYAYTARNGINLFMEKLVGNDMEAGWIDRFIMNRNISTWQNANYAYNYDPTNGTYSVGSGWLRDNIAGLFAVDNNGRIIIGGDGKPVPIGKKFLSPRLFRSLYAKNRRGKSLLYMAIQMAIGLTVRLGFEAAVARFRFVARAVNAASGVRARIGEAINARFGGQLGTLQNLYAHSRVLGNVAKIGLGSVSKALIPAALGVIAFNSLTPLVTIGVPCMMLNYVMDMAKFASNPQNAYVQFTAFANESSLLGRIFRMESFKNLGTILYAPHADASILKYDWICPSGKMPRFFGLERFIYDLKNPVVNAATGELTFKVKNNLFAKIVGEHANVRGLFKGVGKSFITFSIAYALTGNYIIAGAVGLGTIAAQVGYEHLASSISLKLPGFAGRFFGAVAPVGSALSGIGMGGVSYAIGIAYVKSMIEAYIKGGAEWDKWVEQNLGSTWVTGLSALNIVGLVTGFQGIVAGSIALAKALGLAAAGSVSGWWVAGGGIIGGIIGAVVGGIFGATVGGIVGGTIGGALGFVVGAAVGTAFFGIGAIAGGIIGSFVGGLIGSFVGVFVEKQIGGFISSMGSLFRALGAGLNLLSIFKMLTSRKLTDVATGAFMLVVGGFIIPSVIQQSTLNNTTYVSSGEGEGLGTLPPAYSDFAKDFVSFEDEGKTVVYKLSVSNQDTDGSDILISFNDLFKISSSIAITVESSTETESITNPTGITVKEKTQTTLKAGDSKELIIKFKATSAFNGDTGIINNLTGKKLCNVGAIEGKKLSDDSSINVSKEVCIDKDGKLISTTTPGEFVDCNGESPIAIGVRDTTEKPLPESNRPDYCIKPTQVVLHWSAGQNTTPGANDRTWNALSNRGVSCHLGIDPEGTMQMLELYNTYVRMSWCQGPIFNTNSISIEIAGSNFDKTHAKHVTCVGGSCTIDGGPNESGYYPPTEEQTKRIKEVLCWLENQYSLTNDNITGHLFTPYQAPYADYATPVCGTAWADPGPMYGMKWGCKWDPGFIWLKELKETLRCSGGVPVD